MSFNANVAFYSPLLQAPAPLLKQSSWKISYVWHTIRNLSRVARKINVFALSIYFLWLRVCTVYDLQIPHRKLFLRLVHVQAVHFNLKKVNIITILWRLSASKVAKETNFFTIVHSHDSCKITLSYVFKSTNKTIFQFYLEFLFSCSAVTIIPLRCVLILCITLM